MVVFSFLAYPLLCYPAPLVSAGKGALECVPLSLDISPLHFLFWNFLAEDIYFGDYRAIKALKDSILRDLKVISLHN